MESTQVVKATGLPMQLQTLTSVARAMALPQTSAPLRLPSFPSVERTSVLSFNSNKTLDVTSGSYSNRCLLQRQATFPLWTERQQGGVYSTLLTPTPEANYPPILESVGSTNTPTNWVISRAGSGSMVYPNWPSPYGSDLQITGIANEPGFPWLGIDHENTGTYHYVPAGFQMGLFIVNCQFASTIDPFITSENTYVKFTFDRYTSPGEWEPFSVESQTTYVSTYAGDVPTPEIPRANATFMYIGVPRADQNLWLRLRSVEQLSRSAGTVTFSLSAPVVFAVAPTLTPNVITITDALPFPGATVTRYFLQYVAGSGTHSGMTPFLTTSAIGMSAIPFLNTRLTAVAALFTNVTKVLSKEGTVLAARFNPEQTDVYNVPVSAYQDVHPSEKYYFGLEKGFYTYTAPSTDTGAFWDYTLTTVESHVDLPVVRLDNTAMVNSFYFSDPDGGSSLAVSLDWHIEFRNSSQLWPIGLSSMTLETLHSSQVAMLTAGFFFDNIDHKWILGKIAQAAKFLQPSIKALNIAPVSMLARAAVAANERWGKQPKGKGKGNRNNGQGGKGGRRDQRPKPAPTQPKPTALPNSAPPKRRGGLDMYLEQKRRGRR